VTQIIEVCAANSGMKFYTKTSIKQKHTPFYQMEQHLSEQV